MLRLTRSSCASLDTQRGLPLISLCILAVLYSYQSRGRQLSGKRLHKRKVSFPFMLPGGEGVMNRCRNINASPLIDLLKEVSIRKARL